MISERDNIKKKKVDLSKVLNSKLKEKFQQKGAGLDRSNLIDDILHYQLLFVKCENDISNLDNRIKATMTRLSKLISLEKKQTSRIENLLKNKFKK